MDLRFKLGGNSILEPRNLDSAVTRFIMKQRFFAATTIHGWNGMAHRRGVSFETSGSHFSGRIYRPFETCPCIDQGGETRRTDSVGVKYQGEAKGRGGGKARDGSGHGKRYRASWNRGNEPDIDRVDRAYSPRLYVRLFAEK